MEHGYILVMFIVQSCFWYLSATHTELARWSLALKSLLYLLRLEYVMALKSLMSSFIVIINPMIRVLGSYLETTEERAELFVSDASPE